MKASAPSSADVLSHARSGDRALAQLALVPMKIQASSGRFRAREAMRAGSKIV